MKQYTNVFSSNIYLLIFLSLSTMQICASWGITCHFHVCVWYLFLCQSKCQNFNEPARVPGLQCLHILRCLLDTWNHWLQCFINYVPSSGPRPEEACLENSILSNADPKRGSTLFLLFSWVKKRRPYRLSDRFFSRFFIFQQQN